LPRAPGADLVAYRGPGRGKPPADGRDRLAALLGGPALAHRPALRLLRVARAGPRDRPREGRRDVLRTSRGAPFCEGGALTSIYPGQQGSSRMMRCLRFLTVTLALALAVGTCAQAESSLDAIRTRGVIRIGVKADAPPFGSLDGNGRPVGFEIDLARFLARVL